MVRYLEQEDMVLNHYGMRLKGARALCAALTVNKTITTLRLAYNNISDEGLVLLVEALHHNDTITDIDLTGDCLPDALLSSNIAVCCCLPCSMCGAMVL